MKQFTYEILTKSTIAAAPGLAKEVIDDLNAMVEDYEKLKKISVKRQADKSEKPVVKKKEN